jgi:hypothetical protein
LQQNRYMPTEPNTFEVVVNQLTSTREPYVNMASGEFARYQAQEYQPSQFISGSVATGTIGQLSSDAKRMLKTDTVLMNIAAMELKFNFENRILNAIERETIGKTKIDEALTNPLTAIEILRDPKTLLERDWQITQPQGFLGKAASLAARISGLEVPTSIIPNSNVVLMPGNFGKVDKKNENNILLEYTGGGTRFALNANLAFNKYTPIFANKRNAGQYVAGMNGDPLTLSNNEKLSADFETGMHGEDMSAHGSLISGFAWVGKNTQVNREVAQISSSTHFKNLFKKGSILDTTQTLLDELDDKTSVAKTAIDQTKTKFDDGYKIISRGNGVFGNVLQVNQNELDGSKRHTYKVPNRKSEMGDAELCRVWTKNRTYSKIGDLVRYKELIRKERNSVIDRNANYNIFPSEINVNTGYGRLGNGKGDAAVEAFGEMRARKYMFSLENLAWRDSKQFVDLPNCEKGPNGGRIMWFPPYDIQFNEDNTANWTTHQFLGRPEPIYTYNNTERAGTLSFKIVVDHPSILNTLVKYELSHLSDNDVDEILASFWAGCAEYDVFELARIWGVLTDQDINYFKDVIADIDPKLSNTKATEVANKILQKNVELTNEKQPPAPFSGRSLFFENDIPLPPKTSWRTDVETVFLNGASDVDVFFTIKSYDEYFKTYSEIARTGGAVLLANDKIDLTKDYSSAALKSKIHKVAATRDHYRDNIVALDFHDYSRTIGARVGEYQGINYFFHKTVDTSIYGFEKQKQDIAVEIADSKYDGFHMNIELAAYASPVNTITYNNALAQRRFKSVAKWIILKLLKDGNKKPTTKNGADLNETNIDSVLADNKIEFYKNENELVTLTLKTATGTTGKTVKQQLKEQAKTLLGPGDTYKVHHNNVEYTCYCENTGIQSTSTVGQLEPDPKKTLTVADVVCADLSILASYARRVDVSITTAPTNKPQTILPKKNDVKINTARPKAADVTKREIVQKLLNKLVTECDYFEYLKKESPAVYKSFKEKLKYFQPAFHAMTPEGLNARLTFLQQCLRPGETIKRAGTNGCDAVNTSFGKPPVCVLRIGDLYNTKIIINNLSIQYDPLVWDLNPEGIGAQPMLATVNISFKYIGGSGIRKYVEQLQNALSFNYYANTDMYDDRTFANTDAFERDLINLEQDFFAGDTLDIAKIVELEPIKANMPEPSGEQATLIGRVVETKLPHLAGGPYDVTATPAEQHVANAVYVANSMVLYPTGPSAQTYIRKAVFPDNTDAPTNTEVWEVLPLINHGEEAYLKEYGRNYITFYTVDYKDTFKKMYQSYLESLGAYAGFYDQLLESKASPVMLNFLMKQKWGANPTSGSTAVTLTEGFTTGKTIEEVYQIEATERNYKPYYQLGSKQVLSTEIMRLHLYPQDKFYRMSDGNTLGYPFTKIDPGQFQGLYLKDKSKIFDHTKAKTYFDYHLTTMNQKIDHDLLKFMHQNTTVFDRFMAEFTESDKAGLRSYLKTKFNEYAADMAALIDGSSATITDLSTKIEQTAQNLHKVSVVLNGNDGIRDRYLEVVPNGTTVSNIETIFGYNPYKNVPIVLWKTNEDDAVVLNSGLRTYEVHKANDIVVYGMYDGVNYTPTEDQYEKYLRLGNSAYYFKQMSRSGFFDSSTSATDLSATKLPYLKPLNDGFAYATNVKNVDYTNGVGLAAGNSQTTEAYDATWRDVNTVFEKLNFELLDFSQRTLSVMVGDSIANETTFDTVVNTSVSSQDVLQQILEADAGLGTVDAQNTAKIILGTEKLYQFTFEAPTSAAVLGMIGNDLIELNTLMKFNFNLTLAWLKRYNQQSDKIGLPPTFTTGSVEIGCYDEIFFFGWYTSLLANGAANLVSDFKQALNSGTVVPPAGLNGRQQKDYIKNSIVKREKIAAELVSEMETFIKQVKPSLDAIGSWNESKISLFSSNARMALFNDLDNNSTLAGENYENMAERLMKAVKGDEYTLMMRHTGTVDPRTKSLLNKLYNTA